MRVSCLVSQVNQIFQKKIAVSAVLGVVELAAFTKLLLALVVPCSYLSLD